MVDLGLSYVLEVGALRGASSENVVRVGSGEVGIRRFIRSMYGFRRDWNGLGWIKDGSAWRCARRAVCVFGGAAWRRESRTDKSNEEIDRDAYGGVVRRPSGLQEISKTKMLWTMCICMDRRGFVDNAAPSQRDVISINVYRKCPINPLSCFFRPRPAKLGLADGTSIDPRGTRKPLGGVADR